MAIHTEQASDMQQGFGKTMDSSGLSMMFDALQKSQYSFPVKSTVRELLSNGIDSVSEKKVARNILTGLNKVEDYFVEREGDIYKDSHFDANYYDLKWLSEDDTVKITYTCSSMERDRVVIQDFGVGLGGKRLEKYFSLGFSTKRLSKLPLGKFGLGAKSPLSLGIDMYTMESCYNGQLFRFNIYSKDIFSIIPQWNLDTGKENPHILFAAGTLDEYKVYYTPTLEKNSVSVILDAKKHHKTQYIEAVKSQMLYFTEIDFTIIDELGNFSKVDYQAKILYEDDMIILSDNQYYSKPHLLLNKVNYGYVNWEELELEQKYGNIGIKVAPEDIDVNPSRESVLWTDLTKQKINERFQDVVGIATSLIQKELQEQDFVRWLRVCFSVHGNAHNRKDVVGQLSKIIDIKEIKPKFPLDERIRFYHTNPLPWVMMKTVNYHEQKKAHSDEVKKVIRRAEVETPSSSIHRKVVLYTHNERAKNRKDKYLLYLYPEGYLAIYEPYSSLEKVMESKDEAAIEWWEKRTDKAIGLSTVVWDLLMNSEETLLYSEIEVPDSFKGNDEEEEILVEESVEAVAAAKVAAMSAEERRKLEGKTIMYTPTTNWQRSMQKLEVPIKQISDWQQEEEVYYANQEDEGQLKLISDIVGYTDYDDWAEWILSNKSNVDVIDHGYTSISGMPYFFRPDVRLIKVAQNNNRLYREFKRPDQFFIRITNNTITMSDLLIRWNTARLIKDRLTKCKFLRNFSTFNEEYADQFHDLQNYVDLYAKELSKDDTYEELITHLDAVQRFQEFIRTNPDAETVALVAQREFGNRDLNNGRAVDMTYMKAMDELEEFAVACGDLLNFIPLLTSVESIPEHIELEIKQYLEYRGVLEYISPVAFAAEQTV